MKRKAGREQEAPFFYGLVRARLVRVTLLRKFSRTGDHKNKEHKCSFLLWSGASGGRKSPTASPQINQKNKKASFLFFFSLVRVEGVGPSSLPWEGNIIAVIRHSRNFILS